MKKPIQTNFVHAIVLLVILLSLCGCNIPNKEKDTKNWLDVNVKQVKTNVELGTDFDYHSYFYVPENVIVTIIDNSINTQVPGTYTILLNIASSNNISIEKEFSFLVIANKANAET